MPTRQNESTTAAVPSGSPQLTPKKISDPRTMMSACTSATAMRPSSWPATSVPTEVGVERMRRAMPSLRVSITNAAAVSEVRKMNSSSWVLAPESNRPAVVVYAVPSGAVSRRLNSRCCRARGLRSRERVREGDPQLPLERLRGGDRAALFGGDRLGRRAQLLGDGVRAGEVSRASRAAPLQTGVVVAGDHEPGVDVPVRDGLLERLGAAVADQLGRWTLAAAR